MQTQALCISIYADFIVAVLVYMNYACVICELVVLIAAAFVGASAYAQVGITVGGSIGFTFSSAGKVRKPVPYAVVP